MAFLPGLFIDGSHRGQPLKEKKGGAASMKAPQSVGKEGVDIVFHSCIYTKIKMPVFGLNTERTKIILNQTF